MEQSMDTKNDLIWKGKAKDFATWANTMEQIYGKETSLAEIIKDLKEKRLQRQVNYMKKTYGYHGGS